MDINQTRRHVLLEPYVGSLGSYSPVLRMHIPNPDKDIIIAGISLSIEPSRESPGYNPEKLGSFGASLTSGDGYLVLKRHRERFFDIAVPMATTKDVDRAHSWRLGREFNICDKNRDLRWSVPVMFYDGIDHTGVVYEVNAQLTLKEIKDRFNSIEQDDYELVGIKKKDIPAFLEDLNHFEFTENGLLLLYAALPEDLREKPLALLREKVSNLEKIVIVSATF